MKKYKIIIVLLLVLGGLIGGYFYIYKEHRDIAKEEGVYHVTANDIFLEYKSNESQADIKYLDKTITISGKISTIGFETNSIVLDEKLFATFSEDIPRSLKEGNDIIIKGRLIGYDSLLEEIKLDQCIIVN
jgi:hypothetical protein